VTRGSGWPDDTLVGEAIDVVALGVISVITIGPLDTPHAAVPTITAAPRSAMTTFRDVTGQPSS
jgi:hypothetical protein